MYVYLFGLYLIFFVVFVNVYVYVYISAHIYLYIHCVNTQKATENRCHLFCLNKVYSYSADAEAAIEL